MSRLAGMSPRRRALAVGAVLAAVGLVAALAAPRIADLMTGLADLPPAG